jgi:hypothetical protein
MEELSAIDPRHRRDRTDISTVRSVMRQEKVS